MQQKFPDEVAMLIVEDRDSARAALKEAHHYNPANKAVSPHFRMVRALPLKSIRDTVFFAKKTEAPLLQLADTCAFLIRGHLAKKSRVEPLYDLLSSQLVGAKKDVMAS